MQTFTKSELKIAEIGGIVVALVGLILGLSSTEVVTAGQAPNVPGLAAIGWGLFLVALAWTGLASAHLRTNFFSLNRSIDPTICGVSIVVIFAVVVVLHVVLIPRMPKTPHDRLPRKVEARAQVILQERNFKLLVSLAIIMSGVITGSYPIRRLIKIADAPPSKEESSGS